VFWVQACVHRGVGRTRRFSCHVKLEALGLSTAITRFLSVVTISTTDENGKVQVATIAARVSI
jgi:hypothetical protein